VLLVLGKHAVSLGQVEQVQLNVHVLAFTMLLSLLTAILSGLMPAWQASRFDLQGALKEQGRAVSKHRRQRRLRGALVIGEVALSVVLLVGAGLLLRTFSHLLRVNLGFKPDHVLTARMLVTRISSSISWTGSKSYLACAQPARFNSSRLQGGVIEGPSTW
jgi:hypothetical protein